MNSSAVINPISKNTIPKKPRTFASLDLMRGICAFAVLISHVDALVAGGISVIHLPFHLGSMAVEIFMFISGFLMMFPLSWRELNVVINGEVVQLLKCFIYKKIF